MEKRTNHVVGPGSYWDLDAYKRTINEIKSFWIVWPLNTPSGFGNDCYWYDGDLLVYDPLVSSKPLRSASPPTEYYVRRTNLTEYDKDLHSKISRKKKHQEAMKSRSRMHLINNLRKSHIEFEQTKDEESKELLASSWIEDESTQKLISKRW